MKPREPRQKVVLPARMKSEQGQREIYIRDLSSGGMMVQADAPPRRGAYVEIIRPACTVIGRVVWSNGRRFGVQTRERIVIDALLERRSVPRVPTGTPPLIQHKQKPRNPADRAAASRHAGALMQKGLLLAGAAAGAITVAMLIHQSLANSLGSVVTALK